MATIGSLRHIFESTIPENSSSFIDSLSSNWKKIRPVKPHPDHSFTEIFGELHFKENPIPISPSSPWKLPSISHGFNGEQQQQQDDDKWKGNVTSFNSNNGSYTGSYHRKSDSLNSESLQLCTEGLGSESLDDAEDLKFDQGINSSLNKSKTNEDNDDNDNDKDNSNRFCYKNYNNRYRMGEKVSVRGYSGDPYRKKRPNGKTFPPPISCIGRTGKPCVCFQSYRQDGRFVLKEIRIPTHERLQACREDGRLRLSFIQPSEQDDDDEIVEDEIDEGGEEEGEKGGDEKIEEGIEERIEWEEIENCEFVEGEEEEKEEEAVGKDEFEKGHS